MITNTINKIQCHWTKLSDRIYRQHLVYIIFFLFSIAVLIFSTNTISIASYLFDNRTSSIRNNYSCPIQGDKWIVVTTIFYPTATIHKFLNLSTHWNLIVVADEKTPTDWLIHVTINTTRLVFLSIEEQMNLTFRILDYLPFESYARKNLGYLIAIKCGAKIIFESDDDNLLETNDVYMLPKVLQPKHLPWIAFHRQRSSLINIYGSFGHPHIWPRGFPIDQLRNVTEDGWHSVRKNQDRQTYAYIQQYLADLDPDVDAIYRLAHPLSVGRVEFDQKQSSIGIDSYTFTPYNTQNTVTYYEAFWGLYLPVTTTFRVCDIWRGYWVQRLLWDIGGRLIFGTAAVKQHRTNHSSIKGVEHIYQLYNQSASFVDFLRSWSSSHESFSKRISQLAFDIGQFGFWDAKEFDIVNAWLEDLNSVGYIFPSVISPSSTPSIVQKQAAICVTGLTECINEAWAPTYNIIRSHLQGDIDTFLFLSSTVESGPVPLRTRLQQVHAYLNSTVTILYEDRHINPRIPASCKTYFNPEIRGDKQPAYFQQLWALSECYDLVSEYEQKMNIRYELLIRARPDSILAKVPETLMPPNHSTIIIPDQDNSGGYNDRFAIGSLSLMETYMRRWHNLSACLIQNIHAESFLRSFLDLFHVSVQPLPDLSFIEKPHANDQCH